jgi:protein subunit release factor B
MAQMKQLDFGVTEQKRQELYQRFARLGINEKDLEEKFLLSGRKGGQNANRVATKVQIRHLPSNTLVSSNRSRSQALNRFWARRLLADKLSQRQQSNETVQGSGTVNEINTASERIIKAQKRKQKRRQKSRRKKTPDSHNE